ASPCTAINTIAKKMRELDIGAFPVAATTSSSAWSTTATLPSAARRTVAKVQGQGHDDVRLLPRQRGFRGCRLHFRRRAREAPAGAQRGGADGRYGGLGDLRTQLPAISVAKTKGSPLSTGCAAQAAACSSSGFHWPSDASPFMRARWVKAAWAAATFSDFPD